MDIRANMDKVVLLKPLQRTLIKTGLFLEMDPSIECQIRPRSGLALKKGLTVLNTPGTVDADYRGEIGVILINLSDVDVVIEDGERIAQMVFCPIQKVVLEEVTQLTYSVRGAGGFGSTGVK
jgi:dUTP pyrophosphatase